jgi:60 kDa SS-A/Ro ribonucleoprotein
VAKRKFNQGMSAQLNPPNHPQSQPIPGREADMVKMRSGGYGFAQSDWDKLYSLLILGNETGSYYAGPEEMQKEHAEILQKLIQSDPAKVLNAAYDVSVNNLTLKNLYPVYALAALVKFGNAEIRRDVFRSLPKIARTGSDFLAFVAFLLELGVKFGRLNARGIAFWYLSKDARSLAYQMLKYQSRHGMDHSRVFRLAHVSAWANKGVNGGLYAKITEWLKSGNTEQFHEEPGFEQVLAHKEIQTAATASYVSAVVAAKKLTHEMIPSQFQKEPLIWTALIPDMPYQALIRNLGRITAYGALNVTNELAVNTRIKDVETIKRSRVHPLSIMLALRQYAEGKGDKGSVSWQPNARVLDSLNAAFYAAMEAQEEREARVLVIVDVSSSMGRKLSGKNMWPHEAAAAMTLSAMHRYTVVDTLAVDTQVHALPISKSQRLDDAYRLLERTGGGGTDLAVAFQHITGQKKVYDAVLFLTDNESWAGYYGRSHTAEAWIDYRKVAPKARCLFIQMVANGYTVADPNDNTVRSATGFDPNIFRQLDLMLDGLI